MKRSLPWVAAAVLARLAAGALSACAAPDAPVVVDSFDRIDGWTAHPADGVELTLGSDTGWKGRCLRLDFRFLGGGGYAVARKDFDLDLPGNYAFTFRLRGECLPNQLEFKLLDDTGENVWWWVKRDVHFPVTWTPFSIKKRQITFAWGPLGGGTLRHVAAIEIAVTAGSGGTGTVWLDDLELHPLPPPGTPFPPPVVQASSAAPGEAATRILDGDPATTWAPAGGDPHPWVSLDFSRPREFGGLVVDWGPERFAPDYRVEVSEDGTRWETLRTVHGGNGGRDALYLPESESRYLRLALPGPAPDPPPAVAELTLEPLAWSASRNAFFQAMAAEAPRGTYPRGFSGEQAYWTVTGVNGGAGAALLGEDGAVEPGKGGFSVEPFLYRDGDDSLLTWADVETEHSLEAGFLPIPSVRWRAEDLELAVTAFGTGAAQASSIAARYRVRNRSGRPLSGTLYLAVRPFQVDPPTQTLNAPGGTARIDTLEAAGDSILVNGILGVVTLTRPGGFGAATFDGGDIVAGYLARGRLPEAARVEDPFGAAGGAWAFPFDLPPGGERQVNLLLPQTPGSRVPWVNLDAGGEGWMHKWAEQARLAWWDELDRVRFSGPPAARAIFESLRSQLAYILVERAGPALQPGSRSYARSWIRDGALTASALLRLGHPESVREFIEWYAPHQYANGKIPCVVDARGADPVPEHDSSGEFIFLVAEYFRYTGDRELAERMWPRVRGAVAYLDSLRREGRTAADRAPDRIEFFGILPPSISHEGYSAKPMHSYWDDFFAYLGFRDAVFLAGTLGHEEAGRAMAAIRDTFAVDLAASVSAAMERHGIDYIPGCADLGDFDPTSTTIALSPTGAAGLLPRPAVERTFLKYYEFFRDRRDGTPWEAFTPYEIRNIGAFVRLGWRERARELLDFFLAYQRPPGWRQWPEVVRSDPREPGFLGDLPHTWVGSDFIRSVLDLFAYARERDRALVVAAGIPGAWVTEAGLSVQDLRTPYGRLSLHLRRGEPGMQIDLDGDARPPGGIRLVPPLDGPAGTVLVNDVRTRPGAGGEILVRTLPARVVVRP